jgi:CheY-like chemotaxis protein
MDKTSLPPVLAAEDEETDAFILRRAFEMASVPQTLVVVADGQEAVDYLGGNPPYADRVLHPLPGLLLLDLKMPRMNGFDVLAWLASRPDFKCLPTVVLSSSPDDADILRARQMGARDYFVKPNSLSDYVKIVQSLHARWLAGMPNPQPSCS